MKLFRMELFVMSSSLGGRGFLPDVPEDPAQQGHDLDSGFGFCQGIGPKIAVIAPCGVETAGAVRQAPIGSDFLKESRTKTAAPDDKVDDLHGEKLGAFFCRGEPAKDDSRLGKILLGRTYTCPSFG